MAIQIVDSIPSHTVEIGDTVALEGYEATIIDIEDGSDFIVFTYIDEYQDTHEFEVDPDHLINLYGVVNDPDEDI